MTSEFGTQSLFRSLAFGAQTPSEMIFNRQFPNSIPFFVCWKSEKRDALRTLKTHYQTTTRHTMDGIRRIVSGDAIREKFEGSSNIGGSTSSQSVSPRMPLPQGSIRDLDIIPYTIDGRQAKALLLTDEFISRLNIILRTERKMFSYMMALESAQGQAADTSRMITKLYQKNNELPRGSEARLLNENLLQTGMNVLDELHDQILILADKLEKVNMQAESPEKDLYRDLGRVFQKYDLLDDISETSDENNDEASHEEQNKDPSIDTFPTFKTIRRPADTSTVIFNPNLTGNMVKKVKDDSPLEITPPRTPSEAQGMAERRAWYSFHAKKRRLEDKIGDLQEQIDDWHLRYEDSLRSYKDSYARGETDDSRTMFDCNMLVKERAVVKDLIATEGELVETMEHGRVVGITWWCHSDQESNFTDHYNDGYTISQEQDYIPDVDYLKIEEWVRGLPDDGPPSPLVGPEDEADDWNVREVGFGESISVIAKGKSRARIDRWRSTQKQNRMTRFVEDVDTEIEYQHNHQKRRCKRSRSVEEGME